MVLKIVNILNRGYIILKGVIKLTNLFFIYLLILVVIRFTYYMLRT